MVKEQGLDSFSLDPSEDTEWLLSRSTSPLTESEITLILSLMVQFTRVCHTSSTTERLEEFSTSTHTLLEL